MQNFKMYGLANRLKIWHSGLHAALPYSSLALFKGFFCPCSKASYKQLKSALFPSSSSLVICRCAWPGVEAAVGPECVWVFRTKAVRGWWFPPKNSDSSSLRLRWIGLEDRYAPRPVSGRHVKHIRISTLVPADT